LSDFIWDKDESLLVPHLYVPTTSQVSNLDIYCVSMSLFCLSRTLFIYYAIVLAWT